MRVQHLVDQKSSKSGVVVMLLWLQHSDACQLAGSHSRQRERIGSACTCLDLAQHRDVAMNMLICHLL
jgi:hypothetical protein